MKGADTMGKVVTVQVDVEEENAPSLYWAQDIAYAIGVLEGIESTQANSAKLTLLKVLVFLEAALDQSEFRDEDSKLGPWIGGKEEDLYG